MRRRAQSGDLLLTGNPSHHRMPRLPAQPPDLTHPDQLAVLQRLAWRQVGNAVGGHQPQVLRTPRLPGGFGGCLRDIPDQHRRMQRTQAGLGPGRLFGGNIVVELR